MTLNIYHFTDTGRLPWIMASLELRPGANALGRYPDPDFVWATSDARGSRTAAGGKTGYREGMAQLVRFTLDSDDFVPWTKIGSCHPSWTPEQIARLEQSARRVGDDPSLWWCRASPLPLERGVPIETRSYSSAWTPWRKQILVVDPDHDMLGVMIAGRAFLSRKIMAEHGATSYAVSASRIDSALVEAMADGICERQILCLTADPDNPNNKWRAMASRFADEITSCG